MTCNVLSKLILLCQKMNVFVSSCVAVYERDDVQAAPQGEDVHFA